MSGDRITLFLLPYAGAGTAVYRDWPGKLPAWVNPVALTMPGRGARFGQPIQRDWAALIDLLADEARPHLDRPFAIFGHSMGALVGFELAHAIRARYQRSPLWFGASGCTAPSQRIPEFKWLHCPEQEILDELRVMGGTPTDLLDNRDLLDLLLPVLRADFHLCGSYVRPVRPQLTTPTLVLGGKTDRISQPASNLQAWSEETSGPCTVEMLDAGHFFINEHQDLVIGRVIDALHGVARVVEDVHA